MDNQAGASLLEILLVLAILALVAGFWTLNRVQVASVSRADVQAFVAAATAETMNGGKAGLLYVSEFGFRYGTRQLSWDMSVGRAEGFSATERPIVLYPNGTSSESLNLVGDGGRIGLLTIPRW